MALTVVLWLSSGAAFVALAWYAASDTFPAGLLSVVIAGLGGAFAGGELFVVLGGPTSDEPDLLTLLGSTAGGLLCIELVSRSQATSVRAGVGRPLALWMSLQLWSPVLFTAALSATLGRATDSPLLAIATTLVLVTFLIRYRHHARLRTR